MLNKFLVWFFFLTVLPIGLSNWEYCPGPCLLKNRLPAMLFTGQGVLGVKITSSTAPHAYLVHNYAPSDHDPGSQDPGFSKWLRPIQRPEWTSSPGLFSHGWTTLHGVHNSRTKYLPRGSCLVGLELGLSCWADHLCSPSLSHRGKRKAFPFSPSICNCALGPHIVRDSYWSRLETYSLFWALLLKSEGFCFI